MRTLVLYSSYTDQMSYYDDWIDAFRAHPSFQALCVNVFHGSTELFSDVKKKKLRLMNSLFYIIQ